MEAQVSLLPGAITQTNTNLPGSIEKASTDFKCPKKRIEQKGPGLYQINKKNSNYSEVEEGGLTHFFLTLPKVPSSE